MKVAAFIFALIGAGLNLFQPVISVPIPGLGLGASMFDIFLFFMNMISARALQEMGFLISLIIFILLISVPAQAVKNGIYALQRNKDKNVVGGFIGCAAVYVIVALIVFLIPHLASSRAEDRFLMQYGLNNVIPFTTPLLWAACYGVAAILAHTDENSEQYQKTSGASSRSETSTQSSAVQEKIKTFEPVLGVETEALIKRAFIFMADNDFDEAGRYFEQALRQDPENSQAYLGKLMAELKVHNTDELIKIAKPLKDEKLFQRALNFAKGDEKTQLESYVETQEQNFTEQKYIKALDYKVRIASSSDAQNVIKILASIVPYKDSETLIQELEQKKEELEALEKKYMNACVARRNVEKDAKPDIEKFNRVAEMFEEISDYKDSKSLAEELRRSGVERVEKTKKDKRDMIMLVIILMLLIIAVAGMYAYNKISERKEAERAQQARIEAQRAKIEAEKQEEKSRIEALKLQFQGQN